MSRYCPDSPRRSRTPAASSVEPRTHGAGGDAEGQPDVRVAEVCPRVQQENIAVSGGQVRQGVGEARPQALGIDACIDRVGPIPCDHGDLHTRDGIQSPHLAAAVVSQQVGGDTQEPWTCAGAVRVVPATRVEGDREDLCCEVDGNIHLHATGQIGAHRIEVAIEDMGEDVRLVH